MEWGKIKRNKEKKELASLLLFLLMKKGKRTLVESKLVYFLKVTKKEYNRSSGNFLSKCVTNSRPYIGFLSKKVGQQMRTIPVSLGVNKEVSIAFSWIMSDAAGVKVGGLSALLEREFEHVYNCKGKAVKKRFQHHKLAEKSRVYLKHM